MEYSSEVQRRLGSATRSGLLPHGSVRVASGQAEDKSLNVWVCFQVEISGKTVRSARFEAYGCPHFIAAADWMAERVEGGSTRALGEAHALAARAALDVPTEKLGKLLVLEDALAACLGSATHID